MGWTQEMGAGVPAGARRALGAATPIVDAALVAEHVTRAFYYMGLTTPLVIGDRRLAGRSRDPNNPGLPPGGSPDQVSYLQAALDAEVKHADMWTAAGAVSHIATVFFPVSAVQWLGTARVPTSYLGILDQLETAVIGLYTAAVVELINLRQVELAVQAAEIGGVQAEHRMLGRVISGLLPANNRALETQPFASVADARVALEPFVTGRGWGNHVQAVTIPSSRQAMTVVGKHHTRRVRTFQ